MMSTVDCFDEILGLQVEAEAAPRNMKKKRIALSAEKHTDVAN